MINPRDQLYKSFIDTEWDEHIVYDPQYFCSKFNMTNREARYYLNKYVHSGDLCCIKIETNVYYAKSSWYEVLKKYNKLDGIKVF